MIAKLVIKDVIEILKKAPEQTVFDWKQDFTFSKDDSEKGELIKDIAAIANGTLYSDGYLFFGVNPNAPNPIVGINSIDPDDATLQQFMLGKIDPPIKFLKYEIIEGGKKVVIIFIPKSFKRPHVISCDIGKLRQGQILFREGSSTRGIKRSDLLECFYGNSSPYFPKVRKYILAQANILEEINETLRISQNDEDRIDRETNEGLGLGR